MGFYAVASMADDLFDCILTMRRIPELLNLIRHLENFIDRSTLSLFFWGKNCLFQITNWYIFFALGSYNSHSATIHNDLIERIERMSKFTHLIMVDISTASTLISPLLITFVNYFVYGMGDDSFRFDGALWFPFDKNKPAGFLMAVLFQCLTVRGVFCCVTPIACVYIGSCWSIVTFLKDIANDMSLFKKRKLTNANRQALTESFYNFVRFHANVQELSGLFLYCREM